MGCQPSQEPGPSSLRGAYQGRTGRERALFGRKPLGPYTREVDTATDATPTASYDALRDGEAILIDVREPWEYEQMSIPGALLIPLGEIPDRLGEIPVDRDIYVHCRIG